MFLFIAVRLHFPISIIYQGYLTRNVNFPVNWTDIFSLNRYRPVVSIHVKIKIKTHQDNYRICFGCTKNRSSKEQSEAFYHNVLRHHGSSISERKWIGWNYLQNLTFVSLHTNLQQQKNEILPKYHWNADNP